MKVFTRLVEYLYFQQHGNLAFYDQLTMTLNRNWLEAWAKKHFKNKQILVVIIDLNNLKQVNDAQGHAAGDLEIKGLVAYLRKVFCDKTDFICRLGRDEFAVFTNCKEDKLQQLAHHNFSYGWYLKKPNMSLSVAMKRADQLMYDMKYCYK